MRIVASMAANMTFRIQITSSAGMDLLRSWLRKEVQSAAAAAWPGGRSAKSRPPTAQAIAINFTPPTAAPRDPRPAPTHPSGSSSKRRAINAGSSASPSAARAIPSVARADVKLAGSNSMSGAATTGQPQESCSTLVALMAVPPRPQSLGIHTPLRPKTAR